MEKLKVTVLDMQPITPAVGGGRQRLLGLYHGMGPNIEVTYVGSYDWPGEAYRDAQVTEGLREICVPLDGAHFEAASRLSGELDGATVIDVAFPEQVIHSPAFLAAARKHIATAQVVVFTHPWCYPPLAGDIRADQLVIYDAHNVETLLKTEALQHVRGAEPLLRLVATTEQDLVERSQLVLACSREDAENFTALFDLDPHKLRVVPNGAFTDRFGDVEQAERSAGRAACGLRADRPVAVFMGSMYGPNIEAARYINDELAPALPGIDFVVVGGVGEALLGLQSRPNVIATGVVDDERRDALLLAADVAINPMSAGSGTNIKMFDYMAAGLPVLSTVVGARGIGSEESSPAGVMVVGLAAFAQNLPGLISRVSNEPELRATVARAVRERFSWERISRQLGLLVSNEVQHRAGKQRAKVAMLTTWNVVCGIGEHSAYLAEGLSACGAEVLLLANDYEGHQPLGFERDLHYPVSRAWRWDNKSWVDSGFDASALERVLSLGRPDVFLIQHHSGFLPAYDVERIVDMVVGKGIPVLVEFHDGRNVSSELKAKLAELGATLVFHHDDETAGLAADALRNVSIISHPVRQSASASRLRTAHLDGPIISGFGFLRPYKGVMMAIRVLAAIRRQFPNARYVGWHAAYGAESERHLAECLDEARRLGVADAVEIDTTFHAVEDVISELRHADLILMPYEPSNEGASGAVQIALSAGRPVVVSPAKIFRSVADIAHVVPVHDKAQYAQVVSGILASPERARAMSEQAARWVAENTYERAACRMLSLAGARTVA
ncbi:glycosyltransferase [Pseudoxanthomonas daejeonensis]|uniref:glycosyltransferase family 4 protein n=1 Tax=Pseudoxanthomonas daejeonensis TaxID=266062 RepID=UPI001F5438C0|nr:glycosyltransferase [Pseudoxanthomonas daejeonensis]UNK56441.1 glycosyltransferase [Pseudoxanthomonas daejeonensis]